MTHTLPVRLRALADVLDKSGSREDLIDIRRAADALEAADVELAWRVSAGGRVAKIIADTLGAELRDVGAERDAALATIAEALVWHSPVVHYAIPGYEDYSFTTVADALDFTDDANEAALTTFVVCEACGDMETQHSDNAQFESSLWPCRTVTILSRGAQPARPAARSREDFHAKRESGTGCPETEGGPHYFAFIDLSRGGRVCIDCGELEEGKNA